MKTKLTILNNIALLSAMLVSMTVNGQAFKKSDKPVNNAAVFEQAKPQYGFIENKGQIVDQDGKPNAGVKYLLPLGGNNVVLRMNGFSYDTYAIEEKDSKRTEKLLKQEKKSKVRQDFSMKYHRVDIDFLNANPNPEIQRDEQSAELINYCFIGKPELNKVVRHYSKITYKNLYPKIDLEFTAMPGSAKPVEYNFIIHPGGDASLIKLRYHGANKTKVERNKIELTLAHGNLTETIPLSYYKQSKREVDIQYKVIGQNASDVILSFQGDIEKSNETLVIDPIPVMVWGTYYAGPGYEIGYDVDTDDSGNVYMVGQTSSSNSMATAGTYQPVKPYVAGTFGFIVKFNSAGVRQWGTYYANTNDDHGVGIEAISVDRSGNIVTTGWWQEIPYTVENFITKFDSNGFPIWKVHYGGSWHEDIVDVDTDPSGNIFVVGMFAALDLGPTPPEYLGPDNAISTAGAHQHSFTETEGANEVFLAKFDGNGNRLWGTYYGGSSQDEASSVAVDLQGNVYIAGSTSSPDGIASAGAHQTVLSDGYMAFAAKFNSSGVRQWGTYYGGDQHGKDITVGANGDVYLLCDGYSPVDEGWATPGSHQEVPTGWETLLVKFNQSGVRQWATYYGGLDHEVASAVKVDSHGNVYLLGDTRSDSLIATPYAQQEIHGGGPWWGSLIYDIFLVKFNSSGVRQWGTYLGSDMEDLSHGLAIDVSGNIYVAGQTRSHENIATPNGHQQIPGGGFTHSLGRDEAFLVKYGEVGCPAPEVASLSLDYQVTLCSVKYNVDKPTNCSATYLWDFGDGTTSTERSPVHGYDYPGTFYVRVTIAYNCPSCSSEITLNSQVEFASEPLELEDVLMESQTIIQPQVITSSVSTFSDSWLLEHEAATVANRNSFLNGTEGVWRNNATYSFDAPRSASAIPNIKADGTYALNMFDWQNAEYDIIPNWIKVNTMTQYSPYSYELENRDVLGVYSAALYDYGGHLPSANGNNMRNKEMGYTSFEHLTGNKTTGNFIFGNEPLQAYHEYEVAPSNKNVVVVKAPVSKLQGVAPVDVVGRRYMYIPFFGGHAFNYGVTYRYYNNPVICVQPHPETDKWCVIVLQNAPEHVWSGTLKVYSEVQQDIPLVVDNTVAHSGQSSLKIQSGLKTYSQPLLQLDSGKRYVVSCWVSIPNSQQALTPILDADLGVTVTVRRTENNALVTSIPFTPDGPVIEGWQQVKGVFMNPVNNALIELTFKDGPGTAYYDDLRFHPENGNMKSYVYDLKDYRLRAVLDEENFASFFYYDAEGNLYLTKKETVDGIKTLTENISYQKH